MMASSGLESDLEGRAGAASTFIVHVSTPRSERTFPQPYPCPVNRHSLRMDGSNFGVGVGREKSEELMLALNRVRLGAACAVPCRPDTGK